MNLRCRHQRARSAVQFDHLRVSFDLTNVAGVDRRSRCRLSFTENSKRSDP
jgi:hypothetical protein